MKIRTFKEADTERVVSLWEQCSLTVPWNNPRKDIKRKLDVQPDLFIVGEKDGSIIGSVMGGYDGHRGWLYYLAVHPDWQQQKIGTLLVNEAESRIKKCGCAKINLMVRTGNEKVMAFYRSLGYEVDEVVGLGKRIIADEHGKSDILNR